MIRRATRRATPAAESEDLSMPSPWRLQHRDLAPLQPGVDSKTGERVAHRRAMDLLGRLEANGTIAADMRDAGRVFQAHFRAAALDALRAAPLLRLPPGAPAGTGETMTERTVHARRKVMAALNALGGMDSAAGSCVWHVLGCEASIREWAARQGWGGRRVGHAQAQGILVAALGVLAGHYRLAERSGR